METTIKKGVEARLEDRFHIEQAIRYWARAVDRRDWEMVRSVFHPGATDNHGMYKGEIEGLIDWLKARHECITMSMHFLGNILIEFVDAETAICETYVVAYQRYDVAAGDDHKHIFAALGENVDITELPLDVMMPARYVDEFAIRNGAWRISKRTTVFEGRYFLNSDSTPLNPNWTTGKRDDTDALYTTRKGAELAIAQ